MPGLSGQALGHDVGERVTMVKMMSRAAWDNQVIIRNMLLCILSVTSNRAEKTPHQHQVELSYLLHLTSSLKTRRGMPWLTVNLSHLDSFCSGIWWSSPTTSRRPFCYPWPWPIIALLHDKTLWLSPWTLWPYPAWPAGFLETWTALTVLIQFWELSMISSPYHSQTQIVHLPLGSGR